MPTGSSSLPPPTILILHLLEIGFDRCTRHDASQIVKHGVPQRVLGRLPIDHTENVIDGVRLGHYQGDHPSLVVAFIRYGHGAMTDTDGAAFNSTAVHREVQLGGVPTFCEKIP
jgi:hypothetical protein